MPLISRTFIKAGMVFFALSLILGVLIEVDFAALPALIPLFWHTLMVGWITQIIFGVSLWMFPGRNRNEGFKAQKWGWLTFGFLNIGLFLRVISEPFIVTGEEIWDILLVVSACLQAVAGITYVTEMWPRVLSKQKIRERRKRMREDG